jgi:paraquat-inducible protein B
MVVFGVAKGDRGSYQQWQENHIAPQVVFEILSPGNTPQEMNRKLLFYDRYGVEEYYLYDPSKNHLQGWWRVAGFLEKLEEFNQLISPRLGIQLELSPETLRLYRPNGQPFADYVEVQQQLERVSQQLQQERQAKKTVQEQLQQERQAKATVQEQLQQERQVKATVQEQLQQERQAKATVQEQLQQERQAKEKIMEQAERLEQLLREAGINPSGKLKT